MNEIDIINLIINFLKERNNNNIEPKVEKIKFIVNFKSKTCKLYNENEELKNRDKIYEFQRENCVSTVKLIEEY